MTILMNNDGDGSVSPVVWSYEEDPVSLESSFVFFDLFVLVVSYMSCLTLQGP
jgi:hypothetical protein